MSYRDDDLGRAMRERDEAQRERDAARTRLRAAEWRADKLEREVRHWRARATWAPRLSTALTTALLAGTAVFLSTALFNFVQACVEAPEIDEGFVVARRYHDAYTTTVCTSSGRAMTCMPVVHPESWSIVLATGEGEEEHYVTQQRWTQAALGSWFCVNPRKTCEAPSR